MLDTALSREVPTVSCAAARGLVWERLATMPPVRRWLGGEAASVAKNLRYPQIPRRFEAASTLKSQGLLSRFCAPAETLKPDILWYNFVSRNRS